jgi:hypothetical protein
MTINKQDATKLMAYLLENNGPIHNARKVCAKRCDGGGIATNSTIRKFIYEHPHLTQIEVVEHFLNRAAERANTGLDTLVITIKSTLGVS